MITMETKNTVPDVGCKPVTLTLKSLMLYRLS